MDGRVFKTNPRKARPKDMAITMESNKKSAAVTTENSDEHRVYSEVSRYDKNI